MLLLMPSLLEIRLKDHFEIWQGVTGGRNRLSAEKALNKADTYKVINLSGINDCTKMIAEEKLIDFVPAKDINREKLLTTDDYLLSCKGEVKGYSMKFSGDLIARIEKDNSYGGLVASNHFIVLRPRKIGNIIPGEIEFLHNLLDILTPNLKMIASDKKGVARYLTIKDVGNFRFNFPLEGEEVVHNFNPVFTRYMERLHEFYEAKKELESYNRSLTEKITL